MQVPYSALTSHRLKAICESLIFKAQGDAIAEPTVAYRTTATHLLLPRFAGTKLFSDFREAFPDAAPMAEGLAFAGSLMARQEESERRLLEALARPPYVAMLCLPCGFGKTVISLSAARALGRSVLIVVHRRLLLWQWVERIRQFLPGACVVNLQKEGVSDGADFGIVLIQTLVRRPWMEGVLDRFGTCIIDEAHHAPAATYLGALFSIPCKYVMGLTATPERSDGLCRANVAFFGEALLESASTLESRPRVLLITGDDSSGSDVEGAQRLSRAQKRIGALVKDEARNVLLRDLTLACVAEGRRVLILTHRVEHALLLREELRGALRAEAEERGFGLSLLAGRRGASSGDVPSDHRVVVATFAMAREGLDDARLDTLLLATPVADVQQAIGRICRSLPNKSAPLVLDMADEPCSLFSSLARKRIAFYAREDFEVISAHREDALATARALAREPSKT